ncbi:MAG: CPBP family intramembrane metalloprotease [Bacteroidales bacterium]|nr:CPBP family intramembrane metalloprotease [Bacteroidales bacterium]
MKDLFVDAKPFAKLILALFIAFICYLLTSLITILIITFVYHIPFEELNLHLKEGLGNSDLSLLRIFQISQSIGLFIVPAIVLNHLIFQTGDGFLTSKTYGLFYSWWIVLFTLIFSIPVIHFFIVWNSSVIFPDWLSSFEKILQEMESERTILTNRMTQNMSPSDYCINLFIIAILPAVGEEFFFRGIVQKVFIQWTRNNHVSILISAILFSSIHLQFYGFVPRLILGIYFGYLFLWSRNIWMPVWAHFLNNAIAVSIFYLSENIRMNMPAFFSQDSYSHPSVVILSAIISSVLVLIIYQEFKRKYSA